MIDEMIAKIQNTMYEKGISDKPIFFKIGNCDFAFYEYGFYQACTIQTPYQIRWSHAHSMTIACDGIIRMAYERNWFDDIDIANFIWSE